MTALSSSMEFAFECPCKRWEHRDAVAIGAVGWVAMERGCPRCKRRFLFVFRVTIGSSHQARLVQVVQSQGRDEASLRHTLSEIPGVTEDDVEFLVATARLLAGSSGSEVA